MSRDGPVTSGPIAAFTLITLIFGIPLILQPFGVLPYFGAIFIALILDSVMVSEWESERQEE